MHKAWGRVSTPIGQQSITKYESLDDARNHFEDVFLEKTGNEFCGKKKFAKEPRKYFKHDIDCCNESETRELIERKWVSSNESSLEKPVQDLIKLMLSEKMRKETMIGFDLDVQQLPCGKISDQQILCAMEVLKYIAKLIEDRSKSIQIEPIKFIEASNKFYTMVPHSFGEKRPAILNTQQLVEKKTEMLENLLQIKLSFALIEKGRYENTNPLDAFYSRLKTDLRSVDKTEDDYKMIQLYVERTQSPHHNQWESMEIEDIFRVKRDGEDERFDPFKRFHNRQLLWHGSRATNFAGILLNGLKIAPSEALKTGYIFGKGVYFAEMVSKSALYCNTSKENDSGLMLLCQVALGNTLNFKEPTFIEKLPPNKDSVKAIGKTSTCPEEAHIRADGVVVPLGQLVTDTTDDSKQKQLFNNEYVVFNEAQVKCEYLVRFKFHYRDSNNDLIEN